MDQGGSRVRCAFKQLIGERVYVAHAVASSRIQLIKEYAEGIGDTLPGGFFCFRFSGFHSEIAGLPDAETRSAWAD